jgi:hypothetical protein
MMFFVLKQILRWLSTELIGVFEPILVDFGFPKHNVKLINYHGKKVGFRTSFINYMNSEGDDLLLLLLLLLLLFNFII